MSLEDRIKAAAQNITGKVQEKVGEITGDPETQLEGQAKQAQAQVNQTVENLKDHAKNLKNNRHTLEYYNLIPLIYQNLSNLK